MGNTKNGFREMKLYLAFAQLPQQSDQELDARSQVVASPVDQQIVKYVQD